MGGTSMMNGVLPALLIGICVASNAKNNKKNIEKEIIKFPHVTLKSSRLNVNVYLPDGEQGYYRACRFDWSSMVGPITLDDKYKFFSDWRTPHDPNVPEHGIGFAEEFGMPDNDVPFGFNPMNGTEFLKIGVGVCENDVAQPYNFFHPYQVTRPALWDVKFSDDNSSVTMKTKVNWRDFGYEFKKVITVNESNLHISHEMRNTGQETLNTWTYSHNLFNRPDETIGSNYTFSLPLSLSQADFSPCVGDVGTIVQPKKDEFPAQNFELARDLNENDVLYCDFDTTVSSRPGTRNRISVRGADGAGYIKTGTDGLEGLHLYAVNKVLAVEPFSRLTLNAGEAATWSHTITFVAPPDSERSTLEAAVNFITHQAARILRIRGVSLVLKLSMFILTVFLMMLATRKVVRVLPCSLCSRRQDSTNEKHSERDVEGDMTSASEDSNLVANGRNRRRRRRRRGARGNFKRSTSQVYGSFPNAEGTVDIQM